MHVSHARASSRECQRRILDPADGLRDRGRRARKSSQGRGFRPLATLDGTGRIHCASDRRGIAPRAYASQAQDGWPAERSCRRPCRPEHLDRRVRAHQGPVSMGSGRSVRPEKLLHGARERGMGGQSARRDARPTHWPRGGHRVLRRGPRPADLHRSCLQPDEPAAIQAARAGCLVRVPLARTRQWWR
ncbi:hypothetical protein D3C87_1533430 [compost metagenome]